MAMSLTVTGVRQTALYVVYTNSSQKSLMVTGARKNPLNPNP
jgi:hypothetical protein